MTPRTLLLAAGARSLAIGLTGVLLGLYLAQRGASPEALGFVVGAGLLGLAVGTTVIALRGDRWPRRPALIAITVLSAAGLAGMALATDPAWLVAAALFGMVNGMGRDRGPAQTLEQTLLAELTPDAARTRVFTSYALVEDICGALGALAAGLPALLAQATGVDPLATARGVMGAAAAVMLVPLALYAALPPVSVSTVPVGWAPIPLSAESRRRVTGLAGLFALDSLGGGFIAGAIVSYWFFQRFGLGGEVLGPVFFGAKLLNALSYPAAAWLASRIGLVRTMVFTHLPSSLLLLALPLVGAPAAAIALFLVREALVQMDVPTRQSYVVAVTGPGERTFALGVTGVVRNLGWAAGPPLAGAAMRACALGAPLVAGAGLKAAYDLALFASFRHVHPPEERVGP